MPRLAPKDVIALGLVSICALLEASGHDGPIGIVISMVVGYYFGHRTTGVDAGK